MRFSYDDRRMTRTHHNDGRRLAAHTTRRPTTVVADSAPGGYFSSMSYQTGGALSTY